MGGQVLVTGGSGFVAAHCIAQLLQRGYHVRTTLRTHRRANGVVEMLRLAGISSFEPLSFIEADLESEDNWDKAVAGCEYVLHVASPIALDMPRDENDMIVPAVKGTLHVLKAARDAGVKRVVVTSSFGAVSYGHPNTDTAFTEASWTNLEDKTLSPYIKSKTLAEKAAWDFIAKEGGGLEFTVINPTGIFGPSLSATLSSGLAILKKMLDGSMKKYPRISFAVVDVRDVVDLHIRAMTDPKASGERFIAASGEPMSLLDMALIIRETLGEKAAHLSTKELPDWQVHMAALFNPLAKNIVPQLGKIRRANNEKAINLLGWQPRPREEAIASAAESIGRLVLK